MLATTEKTWSDLLGTEKEKPYFQQIMDFVRKERQSGKRIYPAHSDIFNALKFTPFENVKVVIIGQDPYHGAGQAHGLSFSVLKGVPKPPSLQNIFQELHNDLHIPIPKEGSLEGWAKQGVLLLNASLTVEEGKPQSHSHIGWYQFTDTIIRSLNEHPQGIVYLLWGSYAQRKAELIDQQKHRILTAPHPSPLSAHRGFLGCKHFSKANELLKQLGREPIDWALA